MQEMTKEEARKILREAQKEGRAKKTTVFGREIWDIVGK